MYFKHFTVVMMDLEIYDICSVHIIFSNVLQLLGKTEHFDVIVSKQKGGFYNKSR